MSPATVALVGIGGMLALMFARMPVAVAMLLAGFLGVIYLVDTSAAMQLLAGDLWATFSSYGLSVIPTFIFMGQLAFKSGISERLYDTAYKWVGRLPGGIAATTIVASAGFAAVSASNTASVATMGSVALPEMRRYRYDLGFSGASIAMGGTLGAIIPPSMVLILIAILTEQSITRLFIAAIIPGIILAGLLLLSVVYQCWRHPELGPASTEQVSLLRRLRALAGVLETLILFAGVVGGLYLGWFTPTEAGAAGSFGALLIALTRRNLTWQRFWEAVEDTLRLSAMVLLLIVGGALFGRFLALTRLPFEVAEWAANLPLAPAAILAMVLLIYLIGGCIMDALGFLVVSIPILYPLGLALGYEPVHLTIILLLVTTLGAITPPVGVNAYVINTFIPELDVTKIFWRLGPFFIVYVVVIALVIAVPPLTTTLVP